LPLPFETVLIVTNHVYGGRKASIHFFADDLAARGADVVFLTVDASLVNRLRPGAQFSNLRAAPKRQWLTVAPRLTAFVQPTLIHPANLHNAALNRLSGPIYATWPARLPAGLRRRTPSRSPRLPTRKARSPGSPDLATHETTHARRF